MRIMTLYFFTGIFLLQPLLAHGPEIEVGGHKRDLIPLSEKQQKALNLKVTQVAKKPFMETLKLNGEIQLLPNAQADVSTRISGQVTKVNVELGDPVKTGQPLAVVQSRQIGNPPPSVTITAPMDGIVDVRNINLGQSVEPNTVLFHISHRAKVLMVANVYEEDLGKVAVGQTASVKVLSFSDKIFSGKVTRIEPNLDPLTRTVKIWILLDNEQNFLKPHLFGSAQVVLKENKAALILPKEAMIDINGEQHVFVQQEGGYLFHPIKTGASNASHTEILDGLKEGDIVVTQGNRELYTLWLTGGHLSSEEEGE